jgi:hypothetical protein
MNWTYDEYLDQPEWFILELVKHLKEKEQNQELLSGLKK